MGTVFSGDKVILIREFDKMHTVGQESEVASITDKAIVLRDTTTKIAVVAVDIDDFDKYFTKYFKNKKWTAWTKLIVNDDSVVFYRTNGVKVQVKSIDNIVGNASCHSGDVFNLYIGIRIAYLRMQNKMIKSALEYEEKRTDFYKQNNLIQRFNTNEDTIRKIIKDYANNNRK